MKCPHKAMSYHDANRCSTCVSYYAAHTSYDADGDPFYDPEGGSSGVFGFLLVVAIFVTAYFLGPIK